MAEQFYADLKNYYSAIGRKLKNNADAASIYSNPTDKGLLREGAYLDFLKDHLPRCCSVESGGFVFGLDGKKSGQIDILVTNDACPRFKFGNDANSKSFTCVDGLIAIVSIKSHLDTRQLHDSLFDMAELPKKQDISDRVNPALDIKNYDNWPFKAIYAYGGMTPEGAIESFKNFYNAHSHIPPVRRPDIVHVAGEYCLVKAPYGETPTHDGSSAPFGSYVCVRDSTDAYALSWVLQHVQTMAAVSRNILFSYHEMTNAIFGILAEEGVIKGATLITAQRGSDA